MLSWEGERLCGIKMGVTIRVVHTCAMAHILGRQNYLVAQLTGSIIYVTRHPSFSRLSHFALLEKMAQ